MPVKFSAIKVVSLGLLIGLQVCFGIKNNAEANQPVGMVVCEALDGTYRREDSMIFAALSQEEQGFDLLIVDELGQSILSLDKHLVVQAAGSIEGQEIIPWNLVAYQGEPLQLSSDGSFSLEMFVSPYSICEFRGRAVLLQSAPDEY